MSDCHQQTIHTADDEKSDDKVECAYGHPKKILRA